MYTLHNKCRACGSTDLREVFDLGVQPLANDFCGPGEFRAGWAPLKVLCCPTCFLSQLSVTVDPEILYRHYSYVTSTSAMMQDHFYQLQKLIWEESKAERVLEVGSNDGLFLKYMQSKGSFVLGVDPATNLCEIATAAGVETINGFFGIPAAHNLKGFHPDVVVMRHVFCHLDNWWDTILGLEIVASRNTLICIEVPYLLDMLDNNEFDTIYHEHTSYMTLTAMQALLEKTVFRIHKVHRVSIHGGAIVIMLRHRDHDSLQAPDLANYFADELKVFQKWANFSAASWHNIRALNRFVREKSSAGLRVVGYGASAKSTVWVNACHFDARHINSILDSTPQKIGRFSPGTDIPIRAEANEADQMIADFAVLFSWNFRAEILRKNRTWLETGGKFVTPVPYLEVIGLADLPKEGVKAE